MVEPEIAFADVTPFVGVWIEIDFVEMFVGVGACHSLRGSVDGNRAICFVIRYLGGHSLRGSVD